MLSDDGIELFGEGIRNTCICYINVARNEISEEGAKKFFEILKNMSSVKILDISENMIGDEATVLLTEVDSLEIVDIKSNYISSEALLTFAKSLEVDSNIRSCNISLNSVELADELILQKIKNNCSSLELIWKVSSDQPLSKEDVKAVVSYFTLTYVITYSFFHQRKLIFIFLLNSF